MADNLKTNVSNLVKTIKRKKNKKKNKSSAKSKSEKISKRLIQSLYHRKKSLKMNPNRFSEGLLPTPSRIGPSQDEIVAFWDAKSAKRKTRVRVPIPSDRCPSQDEMDQVALWKARAISLQFENRMLRNHIRQMYRNKITQQSTDQQSIQNENYDLEDHLIRDMDIEESDNEDNKKKKKRLKKTYDLYYPSIYHPPNILNVKMAKEEEMKQLYGSGWTAIRGTETATQLMYNNHVTKNKSAYWPVVPFKI